MDGGRRKLESLDGPLKAVGGAGGIGAGGGRVFYSSRPLSAPIATPVPRAEPVAYREPRARRAPARPAVKPRKAAKSRNFVRQLTRPGIGWAGVIALFVTTGIYGATIGERWQEFGATLAAGPDAFARGSGFSIANLQVEGRKILTDAEIMSAINHDSGQSLVMLDAAAARVRLLENPLVLEAKVRKIYPDTIAVSVVEREPYALWQRGEKLSVIASDGTVIDGVEEGRFANLPMLVGQGADVAAKDILAALEPYPELRNDIYAMVRVGDRRWNLRLTNGMDVKLPQEGYRDALALFVRLDQLHQIKDRNITEIDFRRPGMTTVRLSDESVAEIAARQKNRAAGT